jgi:Raf kinase inhibitor-like YbhB/YbcL family protein
MIRRMGMAAAALALAVAMGGAAHAAGMKLSSSDFKSKNKLTDEQVFNGFGCTGQNVSPALNWSGAPAGTKSFALTIYDPDAPTGSGFWHWVIFNIPPDATSLPKNAGDVKGNLAPAGSVQSRTDFGAPGYGGPCPPKGDKPHHYIFTLYALDLDKLPVPGPDVSAAVVGFNIHFHTLAKTTLTGLYGR